MNKFDKQIKSKLEGFQEAPPAVSWDSIQKGLEQKKPKPFLGYKKIAAAAAIILLVLFVADKFMPPTKVFDEVSKQDLPHLEGAKTKDATADKVNYNATTSDKQGITTTKDANPVVLDGAIELKGDDSFAPGTNTIGETTEVSASEAYGSEKSALYHKQSSQSITDVATFNKSAVDLVKSSTKKQSGHTTKSNHFLVKKTSPNAQTNTKVLRNKRVNKSQNELVSMVEVNKSDNNPWNQETNSLAENVSLGGIEEINDNSQIAVSKQNEPRNGLELVGGNGSDLSKSQEALSIPLSPKKTAFPVFPKSNAVEADLDFEAFDDLLVKANTAEEKASSRKRFDLYAYAAPTHFDIMNGVTMPELEGVEQDFSSTMVYGVRAGYALNSRLKLRTGLSSLQVVARSNDLFFTSNLSGDNIASPNIQAVENSSINYTSPMQINDNPASSAFSNEISALAINSFKGDVVQDVSYLELPLELEYRFLTNKRFAVSSVAGASTFFLTQNSVIVETIQENMELGEANNLNSTSYSANLGLKLDVNVLKNIDLSVEPHFKYLMNSVNNNPEFQPYLLGVNAGLRVSF